MEFERSSAIEAAIDEFWGKGFKGATTQDLARRMGITRSSFYNAFGSRELVFAEAIDAYRMTAPDAALTLIGPDDPVIPAIREFFRNVCRVRAGDSEARGCLVVNSIVELAGEESDESRLLRRLVQGSVRAFERLIAQAVRRGEMTEPANTLSVARALVAFVIGLNSLSKIVRSEAALWRMCEDFLDRYGLEERER